ncbi:MAG: hypothetical protein JNN24_03840 [Hyphomicrobium zavarzinii]|jgi:hypothetical protein|uniref:hypothetical protein n=1 Tax=Hyphomicrobium TaxID=81 RepID=UPI000365A81D|nr:MULTISPECIES: hypothetical protein [Hyphomicrobium]MBL8844883.1 hypothetical protein [Hyphomicrobium zavarzinii]WBT38516.1 hypothetical protein PE058_01185 [Hyphomicrobium sp. DMF-1]HML43787.1 hypothetical protein [Hyphomicrobium zavarzinii]
MKDSQKQTLCFLVLGTSLAVLLQNLAKRRYVVTTRPITRTGGGEVIDFAAWKELRGRNQVLM